MTDAMFDEVSRCRQEITRLTRENSILMTQIERLTLNGIHSCHAECQRPVCRLTRERDALLEALRAMRVKYGQYACRVCDLADAAIAKAEGEKT